MCEPCFHSHNLIFVWRVWEAFIIYTSGPRTKKTIWVDATRGTRESLIWVNWLLSLAVNNLGNYFCSMSVLSLVSVAIWHLGYVSWTPVYHSGSLTKQRDYLFSFLLLVISSCQYLVVYSWLSLLPFSFICFFFFLNPSLLLFYILSSFLPLLYFLLSFLLSSAVLIMCSYLLLKYTSVCVSVCATTI